MNNPNDKSISPSKLRERLQDLENYIEGRKAHWQALTSRLSHERDTIAGLETAVRVRDARISGYARTTARLEKRSAEQQREIASLRKRLAREPRHAGDRPMPPAGTDGAEFRMILRAAYDKLAAMRSEQTRLTALLADKSAYIDRLCLRLSELGLEPGDGLGAWRKQHEIIDGLETDIRARMQGMAQGSRKLPSGTGASISGSPLERRRARLRERLARESVSAMGRLTLLSGARASVDYEVATTPVTIGRGPGNHVCIPLASVSRSHARLTPAVDGVLLEDLGSRNGVRVNGIRIVRQRLRTGDIVAIGPVRFRFTESVVPISRPGLP